MPRLWSVWGWMVQGVDSRRVPLGAGPLRGLAPEHKAGAAGVAWAWGWHAWAPLPNGLAALDSQAEAPGSWHLVLINPGEGGLGLPTLWEGWADRGGTWSQLALSAKTRFTSAWGRSCFCDVTALQRRVSAQTSLTVCSGLCPVPHDSKAVLALEPSAA